MKIKSYFILILLIILHISLFSDNKTDSQNKYNSGIEKFQKNDIDGAIQDFREAITLDERNFKAKKYLVDSILIKSKVLIEGSKYSEAEELLKEAYRHFPSNQEVNDLYKGLKEGTIQAQRKAEKEKKEVDGEKEKKEVSKKEQQEKTITNNASYKSDLPDIERKYALEMEKQRKMYEKIIENYSKTSNRTSDSEFIKKQNEIITSFITKYNNILLQNEEEKKKNMQLLLQQMEQNRKIIEQQAGFNKSIGLTVLISSALVIISISIGFLFLVVNKKNKNISFISSKGNIISELGEPNQFYFNIENPKETNLILDKVNNDNDKKDIAMIEQDMFKDLLKIEKIKRLYNEIKTGNLSWNTVKEYINELEKDLKIEILKVVENKLNNYEVSDILSTLPVIFPFLTDSDDYIREKSKSFLKKNIRSISDLMLPDTSDIIIDENSETHSFNIEHFSLKAQEIERFSSKMNHSFNVARYARGIANVLGLLKDQLYLIYEASLLHDIGYLFLSKEILYNIKTKKELDKKDFEEVKKHPEKGFEFLKKYKELKKEIFDGVLYHHERNDGLGYPSGLEKDKIPLFAKIIGVADTFDALTSDRIYKEKVNFTNAIAILKDLSKSRFDIEIIKALEEYLKRTNLINL